LARTGEDLPGQSPRQAAPAASELTNKDFFWDL